MILLAYGLAIAGSLLLVVAAIGIHVLPDALSRQHAATKAATLALGTIFVAVALEGREFAWWWRSVLTIAVLFATLPVSSHMLARAAARRGAIADLIARADDVVASPTEAP